jgi:hypothetical protein
MTAHMGLTRGRIFTGPNSYSANISARVVPSALASLFPSRWTEFLPAGVLPRVGKATFGVIIRRIVGLSALSPWPPLPPCPWALQ